MERERGIAWYFSNRESLVEESQDANGPSMGWPAELLTCLSQRCAHKVTPILSFLEPTREAHLKPSSSISEDD